MDNVFDHPWIDILTPLERIKLSIGCFADTELILTILPQLFFFIEGNTFLVTRIADKNVDSKVLIQSSSVKSSKKPALGPPVLFTKMSISPKLF